MRTLRNTRGFSLLEAIIAMSILSFGMMAVVSMIDVSFSAQSLSKNTTRATELAAWMMDRIRYESALKNQIYTTDLDVIKTYKNSGSGYVIDTNISSDPASDPGLSASKEWRTLIKDPVMGLPQGRGVVTIVPQDANKGGNHSVTVQVFWTTLLTRSVKMETVLASTE
ncbi:MAG: type IV pilus modification protein PilV [Nitrospiraceae bacterium]|nr:type IV pilus modification protein PilV [Nitrospiraceae bacterium]